MSICTNFNCYIASTFGLKEQRIARELLRNIRTKGVISAVESLDQQNAHIQTLICAITNKNFLPQLEPIVEATSRAGIRVITILDKDYPAGLLELHDPPFCLFVLSKNPSFSFLTIDHNLCVVGSRSATSDAINLTKSLSAKASSSGLGIISGLASGVDIAAHEGMLEHGINNHAVAVLGNDVSVCFPASSSRVYQHILNTGGAIVSEYPPGIKPMKHQFIARNRIMAALSKCTVVVQAKEKSGALHTARTALELGREVAVLPWSLTVQAGKGSNLLLRDGAHPILCFEDLISLYPDLNRTSKNILLKEYSSDSFAKDSRYIDVVQYVSEHSPILAAVIKDKFGLTEVDLIKLEMENIIKRSATSMVSLG